MNTNRKIIFSKQMAWAFRQLFPNIGTILVVAALLFVNNVRAASLNAGTSPSTISYQGTLSTASGTAVNGNVGITFRLYNVQSGGSALWTEARAAVPVNNGLFNVLLGGITPIPSAMWENPTVYLGVQVDGDNELLPREVIGSVPFANHSDNGAKILDSVMCDGCGNVTETINAQAWVPVKGVTANDLVQVTVMTAGKPLLVILNARYYSTFVGKWCGVQVFKNGQQINFFYGDGNNIPSNDFGCSSSILITTLPAGTYTFRAVVWQPSAGDITWTYQRQIAVIEY